MKAVARICKILFLTAYYVCILVPVEARKLPMILRIFPQSLVEPLLQNQCLANTHIFFA